MHRLFVRVAALMLGLLACVPLHYLWCAVGRHSPWPRRFLFWVGYVAGLRTRIVGQPLARQVLYLCNHLSWLDIMAVAGATGAAFVSRDDVARWPVIGWLARLNDTIFVARESRSAVRGQADALRVALASGRSVALFPEGTTAGGTEVLPFRASLLASLFPPVPGVQVQPVALDYGEAAHDIAWIGDEPAAANARRLLSRPGTIPLTIHFLAPVDPARMGDRKHLAAQTRIEILEAMRSP